jgi:hypothetical protein
MKKLMLISLAILILAGGPVLVSCQASGTATALLQGAVTIGPITPVEQPGQCPPVSPETFSSRKVIVYDGAGENLLQVVDINQIGQTANGYYTVLIAPGTYTVDINHAGIDHADGLPKKVTISANQTVTVDINIDTGIR